MPIDPYLIPGTEVLRNLLGITTEAELYRVEGSVTTARINQLEQGTVRLRGRWDIAHLQAVHRHIFQDVYDWAGKLRTIAMSKGPDLHPLPRMAYGLAIFERLAQDSQLRGLETEAFVAKLSQVQSELFAWHPFREGNTRSTTTFVSLLARQAGWSIAWRDADPAEMQQRIRASFRAPERVAGRELEALLGSIISPNPR